MGKLIRNSIVLIMLAGTAIGTYQAGAWQTKEVMQKHAVMAGCGQYRQIEAGGLGAIGGIEFTWLEAQDVTMALADMLPPVMRRGK